MTYDEKKSLYESIMKEVARQVKRSLNESFNSNITKKLYMIAKNYSAKYPNIRTTIDVVSYDSDVFRKGRISDGLQFKNGKPSDWNVSLSDFTDDSFGTHLMIADDAREYLSPFYKKDKKGQEKIEKQGYIIVRRIKEKYDIDDIQSGNIPKDKEDVLAFIQLNEKGRELFDEMGKRWLKRQDDENKPLTS